MPLSARNSTRPGRGGQSAARFMFMWADIPFDFAQGRLCPPFLICLFMQGDKPGCPIFRVLCERWDSTNLKVSRCLNPMSRKSSQAVKLVLTSLLTLSLVPQILAQITDSRQTMRPVIRGRHAAVASMKAEATEVARQILEAGGNAFDAAVGGQAALAVTDFSLNGMGSDAVLLVYNAR